MIQDMLVVLKGGLRRGIGAPSLLHLDLTLNGSRWGGSRDSKLHFDVLGTGGSSISARAGDLQGLDNAAARNTLRLYSAWWQQDIRDKGLWIRLGLQDYNALFDTLDAASLFINSSFGIEPTISQSGVSIFPRTTLGGVLHWRGTHGAYVMGGLYSGAPGQVGDPYGTHIGWRPRDGIFSGLEAGLAKAGRWPMKLALGAWIDTSHLANPLYPQRNHGLYLIGQARLVGSGTHQHALDGFVQFGSGMARNELIDRYFGAGLRMLGVWLPDQRDSLGIAVARAEVRGIPGRLPGGAETVLELTWSAPLDTYLRVQPDLQYIHHPGATASVPDALVAGIRLHLSW